MHQNVKTNSEIISILKIVNNFIINSDILSFKKIELVNLGQISPAIVTSRDSSILLVSVHDSLDEEEPSLGAPDSPLSLNDNASHERQF